MYGQCGSPAEALVFTHAKHLDHTSLWNAMMAVYSPSCPARYQEILELYHDMQNHQAAPDDVTYTLVLTACGDAADIVTGRHLHNNVHRNAGPLTVNILASLIAMFSK